MASSGGGDVSQAGHVFPRRPIGGATSQLGNPGVETAVIAPMGTRSQLHIEVAPIAETSESPQSSRVMRLKETFEKRADCTEKLRTPRLPREPSPGQFKVWEEVQAR